MTFSKGPVSVVLPAPQDIVGISDVEAIDGIAATTVAIGMLQAAQVRLIAHVNSLRDRDRSVPDELAPELGVARHIAEQRVGLSDALLTRLPATLAALEAGTIDLYKAAKIDEATAPLSDEQCRELDAQLARD